MRLYSTGGSAPEVDFADALFQGLAPDGGLYMPTETPDLRLVFQSLTKQHSFQDVAAAVIGGLLGNQLGDPQEFAHSVFPFAPELSPADEGLQILELWHGRSAAFKDYGASFLAASMERLLHNREKRAVILTATSGDTGSAVAQAFYGREHIDVVILYPDGRVSPLQEKQLTTLGGNIHALRVDGAFDDCQRIVKEAFMDRALCGQVPLTSANSINIGRLIPQSFYYIYAWAQLAAGAAANGAADQPVFVVPSGNFGNLTAGVLAWKWGLPVRAFVAATNQNDVVPEYLQTGIYSPRDSVPTYSNAMDVGRPSNFDRLERIFDGSVEKMREMLVGEMVTDDETLATMQRYQKQKGIILDPHTAVGITSAERRQNQFGNSQLIVLGTAHPGKFREVVQKACGEDPVLPERLQAVLSKKGHADPISANVSDLKDFLLQSFV